MSDFVRLQQSKRMIELQYNAVVIGAGPAGSMAAFEIASAGHSVLMLEKHSRPGVPLCCGEGVGRGAFEKLISPRPEWISSVISRARVIAPDGTDAIVTRRENGYILDRKKLDFDLASRAVEAGCRLECDTIGLNLTGDDRNFDEIDIKRKDGNTEQVTARLFIAADGVESRIARTVGMDTFIDIDDVESLLEYRVENISVSPDLIEFYVGNNVAPKGYLWVFPKSATSANIGIGIITDGKRGGLAKSLLDEFMAQHYPNGNVIEKMAGLTPKYNRKELFRRGNLLVVGDAARILDSLTGAGIVNAMLSGRLAGLAAVEYLSNRVDDIEETDRIYPGLFLELKGDELSMYRRLKNAYTHLNDEDFIDIVKALNTYFEHNSTDGVNASKLLAGIIISRPQLIRLARYII
ncbi:MAG: NAD(P)/FAD-dependent oxidoreductase [Candidatus Zixiibacteriota bacterium]